ncbi:MAG: 2TM domain-containing protein [Leptolyngbya sp. RL_3_1]|nr:2TM domain-containing protein [Leptolyngbya sp. RL_3_1]
MTDSSANAVPVDAIPQLYPSEEAQAILQIAITRQAEGGELTRLQLLEIAAELGITEATLTEAEQIWQTQRSELADRTAFQQFRRQRFQHHLIRYGVVNIFLMALNYLAADRLSWSLYILLIWGLALALQGWNTFRPEDYQDSEEFEKWRRRQQIKRSLNRFMDWLLGT